MSDTADKSRDLNSEIGADARRLLEHSAADRAAKAADVLARYLEWKRPDLAESVASIRELGEAIRRSTSPNFSFRHAVCFVDRNGNPLPRSSELETLAWDLLLEYGEARGGVPVLSKLLTDSWDFGRWTAYAMEYVGGPTEPSRPTRLNGAPKVGLDMLRGGEEHYTVT